MDSSVLPRPEVLPVELDRTTRAMDLVMWSKMKKMWTPEGSRMGLIEIVLDEQPA